VVFCRACAKTCGPDALSFPDKPAIVTVIKKLHAEEAQSSEGAESSGEDEQ